MPCCVAFCAEQLTGLEGLVVQGSDNYPANLHIANTVQEPFEAVLNRDDSAVVHTDKATGWHADPAATPTTPFDMYVDASFGETGTVGYIATDKDGLLLLARACSIGEQPTSTQTEMAGVHLALNDLSRAHEAAVPARIHTDCEYVLNKVRNPRYDDPVKLINGIRYHISNYKKQLVDASRETVGAADALATAGRDGPLTFKHPALTGSLHPEPAAKI